MSDLVIIGAAALLIGWTLKQGWKCETARFRGSRGLRGVERMIEVR